jgi:hypothetical protein
VPTWPCWGFEGPATEIPAPPSDHIPLRRRCAFGGSIPHQTTPSCWLQRTGPLAAGVLTHWRRNSRRKWLVGVDRLRCKLAITQKGPPQLAVSFVFPPSSIGSRSRFMVNSKFCDWRRRQLSSSIWNCLLGYRLKYSIIARLAAERSFVNFSRMYGSGGTTVLFNECREPWRARFSKAATRARPGWRGRDQQSCGPLPPKAGRSNPL